MHKEAFVFGSKHHTVGILGIPEKVHRLTPFGSADVFAYLTDFGRLPPGGQTVNYVPFPVLGVEVPVGEDASGALALPVASVVPDGEVASVSLVVSVASVAPVVPVGSVVLVASVTVESEDSVVPVESVVGFDEPVVTVGSVVVISVGWEASVVPVGSVVLGGLSGLVPGFPLSEMTSLSF